MWVARDDKDTWAILQVIRDVDDICYLTFMHPFLEYTLSKRAINITVPICCGEVTVSED